MNPATITATLLLLVGAACAQDALGQLRVVNIPTPQDSAAIPLYPDTTLQPSPVREQWTRMIGNAGPAQIDARSVRNVTRPTLTPVLPDPARATGAAVIIAPGGGFMSLSIDAEGFDIAHRLADHGIVAFVLKYRLNETPPDSAGFAAHVAASFERMRQMPDGPSIDYPSEPRSTADALEALRLVRREAGRWSVDPSRVGMIGFSAGASVAMQAVLIGRPEERPAFFGFIYGVMLAVPVPADAPPMFVALALDDPLLRQQHFGLVEAWQQANRPVELHAYQRGGHGFGAGRPGTTTIQMLGAFVAWMDANGWLRQGGAP